MINDVFDNTILCNKCGKKMERSKIAKNGFVLRAMVCPNPGCNEKIIHPVDESEYNKFINLKNKEFKVKMRLVGNSYAVSIPKEIVSFMNEQKRIMDEMVKLCFEECGRVSLNFGDFGNMIEDDQEGNNRRIIKAREYKIIKNNEPVVHARQYFDSAHPENNRKHIVIKKEKKQNGRE